MILVIDTNILFSTLIKPGTTRALLLLSGHSFYAPDFTIQEFNKHLSELEAKTGVRRQELTEILCSLIAGSELKIVPFEEFKNWKKIAEEISPDKADVAY
ncbi:MAG: PIN domain-containing protein, partial [Candidatus Diapherotrites archaeon]|nr:PIN domain-containing protein [Candidatus Diapherotrites archaeon]